MDKTDFLSFAPEQIALIRKTRELLDAYKAAGFDEAERRTALLH